MRAVTKGSTNVSVVIRIIDSTDGTPEQAVEYDTSGIDLWYRREGATRTAITEAALAALDTAHTDGGIEHIDDGYYRLDPPDAAFASGVDGVMIGGAVTGMIVIGCYIQLTDMDLYDGAIGGMTTLSTIAGNVVSVLSDTGELQADDIPATLSTIGANVISILSDTGELQADDIPSTLSTIGANVVSILSDTGELQADDIPATLSTIGGNVDSILSDTGELQADDIPGAITTAFTEIKGATFTDATDSLEAIRNRGDAAWVTGGAGGDGSGLSAIPWNASWDAEVQSEVQDVVGAGGVSLTDIPWHADWDAEVQSEVVDALTAESVQTDLSTIAGNVVSVLSDTGELQADDIPATLSTIGANVTSILSDTGELQADDIPSTLSTIGGNVVSVLSDTGELQVDDVPSLIGALNDISAANINTQVLDVMNTDTFAEPGQGAPAATASIFAKINYIYKWWRNKKDNDGSTVQLYNDAGAVVDQKRTVSEVSDIVTEAEMGGGP